MLMYKPVPQEIRSGAILIWRDQSNFTIIIGDLILRHENDPSVQVFYQKKKITTCQDDV